jgi:hypothetical protein
MSQQAATITSLPMAFEMVKAMQAEGLEWGEGYRPLGRQALAEVIEDQMAMAVDRYLDQLEADDAPDRRNGHPGASAGGLASNPLPRWEKLTMDVSLWARFTATDDARGAPLTGC